ncbi:MAG: hypothetical protein V4629_10405 [Pseudomonadota bacterium]
MHPITAFQAPYFLNSYALPHINTAIPPARLVSLKHSLRTNNGLLVFNPSRLHQIFAHVFFHADNSTQHETPDAFNTTNHDTRKEDLTAYDHPVFPTPEAYHEANQIYLKSQERYPFRFPIINPNHLRSNETFIDDFPPYKIYVVQAQHNDTQELMPHVVTYVKIYGELTIGQVALPISILPWVIDSIQEVYQPGLSTINPPYKQSMGISQKIFEDFIEVCMDVVPDVRLTGRGDECTIAIQSMRRCSNGQSSSQMRGDPLLMATDLTSILINIYRQHASPEEAQEFFKNLIPRLFKR